MKLKFLGICILSLFFAFTASAQSYTFKVIGSKGANSMAGKPLKIGTKVNSTDVLSVGSGAYLSLMHKDGRTMEVTSKGQYKASALVAKLKSGKSLGNKYAKFVADQLNQDASASAAKSRSRHMRKTGSVSRGMGAYELLMPKRSSVVGDYAALKWYLKDDKNSESVSSLKVIALDMSDEKLKEFNIEDPKATGTLINLKEEGLTGVGPVIFKVVGVKTDGSYTDKIDDRLDGVAIIPMDEDERNSVRNELASINEPGSEATALSKMIEARFFEEKDLFSDAISAYEEVLKLSYNLDAYNEMYESFLYRNVLSKEAHIQVMNDQQKK